MLTGVALCGVCEGPVHCNGNKGYPVYRCAGSTGHFSRKAAPIDEYVSEVMIARLSRRMPLTYSRPRAAAEQVGAGPGGRPAPPQTRRARRAV